MGWGMDIRRTDEAALRAAIIRLTAGVRGGGATGDGSGEGRSKAVRMPQLVKGLMEREPPAEDVTVRTARDLASLSRAAQKVGALIVPAGVQRPVWGVVSAGAVDAAAFARVYGARGLKAGGSGLDVRI